MIKREVTYPEKGDEIPLDSNENFLLPDEYYEGIMDDLESEVSEYPSPSGRPLKEKLADFYDVHINQIVVGNGSDAVLDTIYKTVIPEDGIMASYVPSYEMYNFFARRNERRIMEIPLTSSFTVPTHTEFLDEVDGLILCSPNNPTGISIDRNHLSSLLEHGVPVVIDEAYSEYSSENYIDLISEYPNLIIVKTFSKAWGLAGARVGYSISSDEMGVEILSNMLPYNVNTLSLSAACSAMERKDMVDEAVQRTIDEREYIEWELEDMGFNPMSSETNFVFARVPAGVDSERLYEDLLEEGIRIRIFDDENLEDYIRVTVATRKINDLFLDSLEDNI
ncbi:MAG: pyridoxal phosphate-dependent aminotransferase [Thermoplasmatota archaeon]